MSNASTLTCKLSWRESTHSRFLLSVYLSIHRNILCRGAFLAEMEAIQSIDFWEQKTGVVKYIDNLLVKGSCITHADSAPTHATAIQLFFLQTLCISLLPSFSPSNNSFLEIWLFLHRKWANQDILFGNSNCEVGDPRAGCADVWNSLSVPMLCHSMALDIWVPAWVLVVFLLLTFSARKIKAIRAHSVVGALT